MDVLKILILIIIVSSLCFLFFQLWYFIENYNYILEYNNKYSKLEFASTPNMSFIDKSVFDPNENESDVNKKFRCVSNENIFYFVSEDGFSSTDSIHIGLTWLNLTDCINDSFKNNNLILYNPCSISLTHPDCLLLKNLMQKSSTN